MKDLQPVRGATLLRQMVAEGEHECQDFKYLISDARKIARSVCAFANNRGGRLLIGVKDNGTLAGVRNEEDIYVVEQAANRYCRPAQPVDFKAYSVAAHTVVIIASVAAATSRPVMACDTDGSWKAYYRVDDENIAAHPLMVEAWRISEGNAAGPLTFSDAESRLINLISSDDLALDTRDIALRLHISERRTCRIIARLAAIGVLDIHYHNGNFRIRPAIG